MKKAVITLILVLGVVVFAKAQSSINDYKYVVVPHFYEFVKGKDAYRLNTITRFLLRKKGFIAFMQEEINERDYNSNNCLALNANVVSLNSILKTKLKVILKNCDGDIIFESKIGESKVKEYKIAYKEALNKAFESFEDVNYHYSPNKDIISRTDDNASEEEVDAKVEVEKLKAELKELKKEKENVTIVKKNNNSEEDMREVPFLEVDKKDKQENETKDTKSYLIAKSINHGFELINSETKNIEYIIQKTAMKDVYTIKDQNGVVYKKKKVWIMEYSIDGKSTSKTLDIKF
jgi:hypothetical protein